MRFNDTVTGLLILAFGSAVTAYAWTFPAMPAQRIGPSVFPVTIGMVLILLGVALIVAGLQQRGVPPVVVDDGMRQPHQLVRFLLVIAVLVLYAVTVDWIGFFITAFLLLAALMLAFGVRRVWIPPLAAVVTLAIHFGFYSLLRVPLPWGLLEVIAW